MGSKNISIGHHSENLVINDLKSRGSKILFQRMKTPFAEVDIIAITSKNNILLIEVKTLSEWKWIETRISNSQTQRLKRAAQYLQNKFDQDIVLIAAFVIKSKIYYLRID